MESYDTHEPPHKRRRKAPGSASTYVFRTLLEDLALAPDDYPAKVQITCVELWEGNLYIGTSAAEILHYVALPPDPAANTASPSYIFASRLQPTTTSTSSASPGVQQVLVLPKVAKACVLCNGTLTFYSLPELSPAFGNTVVSGCSWIGGENLNASDGEDEAGQVVMICIKNRIRLVRIGDDARRIRNIEYPACLTVARRDNFACVADAQAYALLDVENQQKISLFPISSLDENAHGGQVEDISTKSDSSRPSSAVGDPKGHGRSRSLGTFVGGLGRRSPQSRSQERSDRDAPEPGLRAASPLRLSHDQPRSSPAPGEASGRLPVSDKPLPAPPDRSSSQQGGQTVAAPSSAQLIPHVCSPTPGEFLLTTGTTPEEPGVGIFVNLEGDVVRGTLQFDRYPTSVVVDGNDSDAAMPSSGMGKSEDVYVLASTIQNRDDGDREVIEVRKADADNDDGNEHLNVPFPFEEDSTDEAGTMVGHARLRSLLSDTSASFPEVGDMLGLVRLRVSNHGAARINQIEKSKGANENREEEEKVFAQRLGSRSSRLVLWSGSSIWWLVRNPLVLRLDGAIDACIEAPLDSGQTIVHRGEILRIVSSVSEYEVATETDFLTLKFIRQKTGIILLADTLSRNPSSSGITPTELRALEDQLVESGLDPRIVLSMLPLLGQDIVEGPQGIWIHGGLTGVIEQYAHLSSSTSGTSDWPFKRNEWSNLIKRYLAAWRQRKGFGSIADEAEVFQSVDAALLHLLLHQDDQHSPRAGIPQASRSELYSLVDTGVDCFERAVVLLEQYRRLYVLSRLYQSRKLAGKVLQTWRRIVEGEADAGNELRDGESEIRKYLTKIRDVTLIQEYGTWLARRNPALGVQVFAEDSSRVKFVPQEVVRLLKDEAPDAVKVYLEHLVFGKKKGQYANDLITYYLDSVLDVLEASNEARPILAQSYESYRALQTPKPTYRQFIMDNAISATWWQDRLRLLELLGGSHGADLSFDLSQILSRIEPYEEDLIPESIILDGRQGRHQQALRLLTHGLGDYHTAINYCLMGGASIFHPISGSLTPSEASTREDQATLFGCLLTEFLAIEDTNNRLERTSELLERFGGWYDVRRVLDLIPETWSVELVEGFLTSAFRTLLRDRNEAVIVKALSGTENLQIAAEMVEKMRLKGPRIEAEQ